MLSTSRLVFQSKFNNAVIACDDKVRYNDSRTSACQTGTGESDMTIQIAKTMRELRTSKQNTQEQLASHLGVTVQAVSK